MTQEEKAKAYDNALEIAKAWCKLNNNDLSNDDLKTLFPELKESEDERIRTAIIHFISHTPTVPKGIIGKETMLAWLEKQGKQKEYTFKSIPRLLDMIEPSDKAKTYCQKLIDTLVKEGYAIDAKIVGECLKTMNGEDVPMAIMDEKQGEYKFEMKSAEESLDIDSETYNKIVDKCIYSEQNPKFKKDDWITNGIETVQITGYDIDYGYQVDYKGNLQHRDTDIIEKEYHLWTIQDTKDGDVLVYNNGVVEIILLFKEWKHGYIGTADTYVHMYNYNIKISNWCDCSYAAHPATKEQHDQLKKAMADAGWEFDFEKKELKKIHVIDEGKSEIDYCFTKMMNNEKVSPIWSEEDEEFLRRAINAVKDKYPMTANWLKSLKDRIIPSKQE